MNIHGQTRLEFGEELAWSPRLVDALQKVSRIQPSAYSRTRNYVDGAVTRLSPYLSRGVISTRLVAESLVARGYPWEVCESLIKELAWRDYFQRVWQHRGNAIHQDLRQAQEGVRYYGIPSSLVGGATGIEALDAAIAELYRTGYMHNHVRMYTAALACNIAGYHWLEPARWMYYHLLDGDWASNALSWQWVAGAFSTRKYYANQENINKYCYSKQRGSFLDRDYTSLVGMEVPSILQDTIKPELTTSLPGDWLTNNQTLRNLLAANPERPVLLYHFYNLDPEWLPELSNQDPLRILLWEPSFVDQYPVSERVMNWAKALSDQIPGVLWVSSSFEELFGNSDFHRLHFREHPTTAHYRGQSHPREWLFPEVDDYFPSFSAYWKRCESKAVKMFR
jgi:deoxyribodipyrimidine photo-lyase